MLFNLTTNESIYVPDMLGSELFEWLAQCSLEELDMVQNDAGIIQCLTTEADKTAAAVRTLYEKQYYAASQEEAEQAWVEFCEAG